MTNRDVTIQQTIDAVSIETEMEALLKARPQYAEAVPTGTGEHREFETGSTRAVTSTAAEIPVWNRETGDQSLVLFDALRARMRQLFPADHPNARFRGERVYTLHPHGCQCSKPGCDPAPKHVSGRLACPLSPLHPDRSEVEALGFGHIVCPKPAYFMTSLDVDEHVEKSHPRFHGIRQRQREQSERDEVRQEQAELRAALATLAGGGKGEPKSRPFSQMNREDLTAMAREAGLIGEEEEFGNEVTNKQIREAIKKADSE